MGGITRLFQDILYPISIPVSIPMSIPMSISDLWDTDYLAGLPWYLSFFHASSSVSVPRTRWVPPTLVSFPSR